MNNMSDNHLSDNHLSENNLDIEKIYQQLFFIRQMELKTAEVYPSDKIKSPIHLSIGQEFISVAVCHALTKEDYVASTYRGHAAYLAKGGSPQKLIAEMYGKSSGCAKGRGGSMHLIAPDVNFLGSSAVVATGVPNATGVALAQKMQGTDNIVVCFLGDGATEEGCFYESLNFAGLHKLPILYVVENNQYAIHEPLNKRWATENLKPRVSGFSVGYNKHSSGDVMELASLSKKLISDIREGQGPQLIEVDCYRWYQHVGPEQDFDQGYRSQQEIEFWLESDPVMKLKQQLTDAVVSDIENTMNNRVKAAFDFAEQSDFPAASEVYDYVHKTKSTNNIPALSTPVVSNLTTYSQALNDAQAYALNSWNNVFMMGLDIDDHTGIQGSTKGLVERFGNSRVFTTPLSEDAMTGVAIGAAMVGMRPIHIHIRMDFLMLCMNQLINIAAKAHYMYGGNVSVPLVIRCIIGKSWGQGAQHSQALHSLFMHIPGLKVIAPSNAYDAKGLLLSAVQDNNPVIFMEHRLLYNTQSDVPEQPYVVAIGKSKLVKSGNDITIVAISNMVMESLRAAQLLEKQGISAAIIDPVTLSPLDMEPIIESLKISKSLLVVDNGWLNCGASAEIVARAVEAGIDGLKVKRVGFEATTCPTTPTLEQAFYPNPVLIAEKAMKLLNKTATSDWPPNEAETELLYQKQFKGPF